MGWDAKYRRPGGPLRRIVLRFLLSRRFCRKLDRDFRMEQECKHNRNCKAMWANLVAIFARRRRTGRVAVRAIPYFIVALKTHG